MFYTVKTTEHVETINADELAFTDDAAVFRIGGKIVGWFAKATVICIVAGEPTVTSLP